MIEPLKRAEMVLIRRSLREGWPMTPEKRRTITAQLMAAALGPPGRLRDSAKQTLAMIADK